MKIQDCNGETEYYSFDAYYHQYPPPRSAATSEWWSPLVLVCERAGLCIVVTVLSLGLGLLLICIPLVASVVALCILLIGFVGTIMGLCSSSIWWGVGSLARRKGGAGALSSRQLWTQQVRCHREQLLTFLRDPSGHRDTDTPAGDPPPVLPLLDVTRLNGIYASLDYPQAGQLFLTMTPYNNNNNNIRRVAEETRDKSFPIESASSPPPPPLALFEITGRSLDGRCQISQGLISSETGQFYWVEQHSSPHQGVAGGFDDTVAATNRRGNIRYRLVHGTWNVETRRLVDAWWSDNWGNSGTYARLEWQHGDLEASTMRTKKATM